MGYITSIMSVPKRLTAQQEKFVMFLVYGHDGYPCSQTEAAKLAGYADPKDYRSRLMTADRYLALCWLKERAENSHQCAFAGSVWTE